jgi:drug/metabolite transporter (DMT)-like permease
MIFIGELAAILTSLFFAINSVIITKAGQQVGAVISNRTRVALALLYLIVLNVLLYHQPFPFNAGLQPWTWLSLSGVIGLALGDAFLFQAYLSVGPRVSMLLLSLSTVFGALEAGLFFGESLRLGQMIGIAITLAGILWVILEKRDLKLETFHVSPIGVLFGVLAALGQATGLVFSKQGMGENLPPLSANVIRMLSAVLALWIVALFQKQTGRTIQALRENPPAFRLLALAALVGPVIGVSLSLLAVQNTAVGVASVLTSLAPILMIPSGYFFFHERFGWQAIAGTLAAMVGVAILFLT